MRIIAGKYKHKRLLCPDGDHTRPTTDKNRESLFNILLSNYVVDGESVLDLFCGTAGLGIEALSRGAESAVFVDKSPKAIAIAKKNLELVKESYNVYNTDWRVAVKKLAGKQFGLIFIDPPYKEKIEEKIVASILENNLLSRDGCIVVEHSVQNKLNFDESIFDIYQKNYALTCFTILSFKVRKQVQCIFPGTFDPFTLGHYDVLKKGLESYDKVIVAVADINYKEDVLPLNKRVEIARKSVGNFDNIEVVPFTGMLVDFARERGIFNFIRGYRNDADLEYEYQIRKIYQDEEPQINIDYYLSDIAHISASIVRKMAMEGNRLEGLVCAGLEEYICRLYKK